MLFNGGFILRIKIDEIMGLELRKAVSKYKVLFDLMYEKHNLILTRSEMDEIILASQKVIKENELLHDVSMSDFVCAENKIDAACLNCDCVERYKMLNKQQH